MDAAALLGEFESLGDNCEFGLVQRRAGLEPLGFFRLNFARMGALIRALDSNFAEIIDPAQLEIFAARNGELMARIRDYGFIYHTRKRTADITLEALHAQQVKAVAFLTRKLLEDLGTAEKIFVRKGQDSTRIESILPLFTALRRHGPVTLLWVVPHDPDHPPGRVEVLQPGLLKGYIDFFAPYHQAGKVSLVWFDVCAGAHALWQGNSPPGTSIRLQGPAPVVAARVAPAGSLYRPGKLADLAEDPSLTQDGRQVVEALDYAPASLLHVPALSFGDTDLTGPGIVTHPAAQGAAAAAVPQPAWPAYLLRNATIRGKYGIVTVGDRVVSETLYHLPLHDMPGAAWEGDLLRLPHRATAAVVHSAYHLLAGNLGNYFHWLHDVLGRYAAGAWELLRAHPDASAAPILLVPQLDVVWKWETLSFAVPERLPRIAVESNGQLLVQRLLFAPNLSGGGIAPHPALLEMFDRMRIAAVGMPEAGWRPSRKLFVSRADSRNRVLTNESELAERAARAGFERVVLSQKPTWEQIRLFAEASHIIAPHGAGLANIGFCRPGAALCELHMDRYVHWAFRRLAALRGLRYGCLVGTAMSPPRDNVHDDSWHLEPAALDAVLADPAFIG